MQDNTTTTGGDPSNTSEPNFSSMRRSSSENSLAYSRTEVSSCFSGWQGPARSPPPARRHSNGRDVGVQTVTATPSPIDPKFVDVAVLTDLVWESEGFTC